MSIVDVLRNSPQTLNLAGLGLWPRHKRAIRLPGEAVYFP